MLFTSEGKLSRVRWQWSWHSGWWWSIDQAFLMNHIRKGTRGTYRTGWHQFQKFCKGYRVNPLLAPLPLIVKFVCHLFNSCVSCSVVRTAILAISEYHIIDANTGNTIGQHLLVTTAMRACWQLKPSIPRYHGTYNIDIVLRFIENMGQNEALTLKQLSEKIAFLVVVLTLSRNWLALT